MNKKLNTEKKEEKKVKTNKYLDHACQFARKSPSD